jgi:biotin-(acetyl-CoA carboxylase) ligase
MQPKIDHQVIGTHILYGFSCFKIAWEDLNLLKNKPITVRLANSSDLVHGSMLGVDDTGAMLLKTPDHSLLVIVSGSVVGGLDDEYTSNILLS